MFLIYRLLNLTGSAALPLPALHTAEEKAAGKQKLLVFSLLVLYLQLVYRIVGLPGAAFVHWSPKMNWIPFRDLGERRYLFQTSMNVVMFIPLGIFLPLLWPRYRRVSRIACTGAMVSLMIELLQMFSCRVTDVDDLIMNTLGTLVGFLLAKLIFRHRTALFRGKKDWLALVIINGIVLLVIVFVRYPLMEAMLNLLKL